MGSYGLNRGQKGQNCQKLHFFVNNFLSIHQSSCILNVGAIWYTTYLSIADSRKIYFLHPYHLNLYRCGILLLMFCFYSTWKKVICTFMRVNWIFLKMKIEIFFKKAMIYFLIFWWISSCYSLFLWWLLTLCVFKF